MTSRFGLWTAVSACVLGVVVCGQAWGDDAVAAPWPQFRHDAGHTGLSARAGARSGTVRWRYKACEPTHRLYASPVVAADGTVYFAGADRVLAVSPEGSLRHCYLVGPQQYCTPAVAPDGTVYVGDLFGRIRALDGSPAEARDLPPEGRGEPITAARWQYRTGGPIRSSPTVAANGTVYAASTDGSLYALDPDGSLRWQVGLALSDERGLGSSPAVGPRGEIYLGQGEMRPNLYALDPDGQLVWTVEDEWSMGFTASPAVAADGTVYAACESGVVFAVAPDGEVRWRYEVDDAAFRSSPAVGPDGAIYIGDDNGRLHALGPEGELRWAHETEMEIASSAAVSADGTVYVGSCDGHVYALAADGTLLWKCPTGGPVYSSPAIGANGTVYVGSDDGFLYAIGP